MKISTTGTAKFLFTQEDIVLYPGFSTLESFFQIYLFVFRVWCELKAVPLVRFRSRDRWRKK